MRAVETDEEIKNYDEDDFAMEDDDEDDGDRDAYMGIWLGQTRRVQ